MTVLGLAGTGKTIVAAHLAQTRPTAVLATPTGKSASVLRARTGLDVQTIHQTIYNFRGMVDDEESRTKKLRPVFEPKQIRLGGKVVIIDEVSMVGKTMAMDLLATGARIVAFGDPGQLPPVKDRPFFDVPDVELMEIHRQAAGSPVIQQAHAVRAGRGYQAQGEEFRILSQAGDERYLPVISREYWDRSDRKQELLNHDVILCWRNLTRRCLNVYRRQAFGYFGKTLRQGEPVMCLRNDHERGLYNGQIYTLVQDRAPDEELVLDRGDGRHVIVDNAVVEGIDIAFDLQNEDDNPYALAYAATVHKAQGDQWDRILWVDEMPPDQVDYKKWAYTAITRAIKSVTVVKT